MLYTANVFDFFLITVFQLYVEKNTNNITHFLQ